MEKIAKDKKEWISSRSVLWYLVFTGFAVNYMIRINLNIALVSMIKSVPKNNISLTSECLDPAFLGNFSTKGDDGPQSKHTTEENKHTLTANYTAVINNASILQPIKKHESVKFAWNEKVQGHILGSFFWGHWITQIPGGLLASRYGTKLIFGLSNFAGVVCCFAMPAAALLGENWLISLRALQGFLGGFAWPAMHHLTAKWIPPNERSNFVTAYLGSSVGAALTYPVCGFIIDRWGWELVFYVCGIMGTFWFILWWLLVYDSPMVHPRISDSEREYIMDSLGESVQQKQAAPVPWIKIFTSVPVWMNVIAQWGGVFGLFTLMTHAPTYFKFIHGWNIRATGILSGMPHLLRMLWAFIFSQLGDYLLRSNKMSRSNVRKLATAVCCIGQGVFMIGLAYSGCNSILAIVCLTAAIGMHGAVSTGPLASVVDISPNYAGVLLGIINTLVAVNGFVTPLIVGHLTFQNQTVKQWQKVFWIASSLLFSSGALYCVFARSELQAWNSPENSVPKGPESEMMIMKSNKEIEANQSGSPVGKDGYEATKIIYKEAEE